MAAAGMAAESSICFERDEGPAEELTNTLNLMRRKLVLALLQPCYNDS